MFGPNRQAAATDWMSVVRVMTMPFRNLRTVLRTSAQSSVAHTAAWCVLWAALTLPRIGPTFVMAAEPAVWNAELAAPTRAQRWRPLHGVASVEATAIGMRIAISGDDPYVESPAVELPAGERWLVKARLRSDVGGAGQLFFYDGQATEEQSVRFPVPAARWHDVVLALPPLGRRTRFRFDPPGDRGVCVLAEFRVTRPLQTAFPANLRPTTFDFPFLGAGPGITAGTGTTTGTGTAAAAGASASAGAAAGVGPREPAEGRTLRSGVVTLRHAERRGNAFQLSLAGRVVAASHDDLPIAYEHEDAVHWWRLASDPRFAVATSSELREGRRLRVVGEGLDPHGARWRFEQTFTADGRGGFDVESKVVVDRERRLVFLPSLAVIAAPPNDAGAVPRQALLAGVEYLENESSSSTRDLEGPAARRWVPAPHKPTLPLMAIQADGACVSLSWQRQAGLAPLFDWPDRHGGSRGGLMAWIAPGAEPTVRQDGELLPHSSWPLAAGQPLVHRGHLRVEAAETVTAAVQAFVERRGLPPLPPRPALDTYATLAAAGWLDSPLRDGGRFRHAVGNDFPPQPAFDAAWMLDALASVSPPGERRERWRSAATEAAGAVAAGQEFFAQVGHLQTPLAGLARGRFGDIQPQAATLARQLLDPPSGAFDADGLARYRPPAQGIDYSRTHDSREASGFAALPVARALQAALQAGERELVSVALDRLRRLERFRGGVPRGAQTWEIPLHTPDILAAAHLVKAYVLGYRVTGDPRFLERAREWAWTGVPFIYLDPLEDAPADAYGVGPYATIAVLGATQWKAPVWIGLPVQWCGLVYADALRWLQSHDRAGPWGQLADGITLSAIQQCYPAGHPRAGLLPDSFDLVLQARNPADINPGTLQPLALELLAGRRAYDLWNPAMPGTEPAAARANGEGRDAPVRDAPLLDAAVRVAPVWVAAAGRIRGVDELPAARGEALRTAAEVQASRIVFQVEPWRVDGSHVVVHGAPWPAEVRVNGVPAVAERLEYLPRTRSLVIGLKDATSVRIEIMGRGE